MKMLKTQLEKKEKSLKKNQLKLNTLTMSREDILSKLQTARAPSSKKRGNAPMNWKASKQPASM